jgi:sugar lactone lactonase YvrE
MIFDGRACSLGEGPLWHPLRRELFWFDILGKALHSRTKTLQFSEQVSAAGWISETQLLIASETALFTFDLDTGAQTTVAELEAHLPGNRSNDGRADPWGGFWIGTMGKEAQPKAGSIYRLFEGKLHRLFADITISNAICFAPDKSCAYFTDTTTKQIMRVPLDDTGWPDDAPTVHLDLTTQGLNPDGAVTDSKGNLWVAQWGASQVAVYDFMGNFIEAHDFSASQISCPALSDQGLYATSAAIDVTETDGGKTFFKPLDVSPQLEHRVRL